MYIAVTRSIHPSHAENALLVLKSSYHTCIHHALHAPGVLQRNLRLA